MNNTGIKILVTGGMGYIGSHTVVQLIARGYRVVIADNLCNSNRSILGRIAQIAGQEPQFYEIDLCDKQALNEVFTKEEDIKAVVHFAALKAVGESVQHPLKYYRNNLISLLNLLEVQEFFDANNLVFSSSCTVYGEPDALPVTEKSPVKPATSPYGNTKQVGEEIIREQCEASKLRSIALRYFNPVGAHESALIGELPIGTPNNLVPYITQTAIGKQPFLRVFGNDYPTPDGTCIRDYIHVDDVASAHIAALERLLNPSSEAEGFEVFNIGTGRGNTVLEAIRAFEEASNQKLPYHVAPRRAGDIEKVFADTSLSNSVLHWKAEKDLHTMMASAWEWEKKLKINPLV
jgi:UDP-glucose 4-epimerase